MSRNRIILTLVFVATAAMLIGFALSGIVERQPGPPALSRPEAAEPQVPADVGIPVNA